MKKSKTFPLAALFASIALTPFISYGFDVGSDGSYGAINFADSSTLVTNALNTPVYLLAQTNIVVNGIIDVSGEDGQTNGNFSLPGPGGFAGGLAGSPSANPVIPAGAGQGPGATNIVDVAIGGSFGSVGTAYGYGVPGVAYGNLLLVPLIGGSGGSGYPGSSVFGYPGTSGGAGGGAILLGSSTSVIIHSNIVAKGGAGVYLGTYGWSGGGSGGAIRLVAPTVLVSGKLNVSGGINSVTSSGSGGNGRVRIDTTTTGINVTVTGNSQVGAPVVSYGRSLFIFPSASPQLYFTTVAGTTIQAGTNNFIPLSSGNSTNQIVTLCGTNFLGLVPVQIVATPAHGNLFTTNVVLNFPTANILVSTNVTIMVPTGIPTQLNAYANYGVQP